MPGHNNAAPPWPSSGMVPKNVQNVTREQPLGITSRPDHSSNMNLQQEKGLQNDQRMFRAANGSHLSRIVGPKDANINSTSTASFSHGFNQFQKDGNSSLLPGPHSSFMAKQQGYGMKSSPIPFFPGNIRHPHHDLTGIPQHHRGPSPLSSNDSKPFTNSFQHASFGTRTTNTDGADSIPKHFSSQMSLNRQLHAQPQFPPYQIGIRQHSQHSSMGNLNAKPPTSNTRTMTPSQLPCSNDGSNTDGVQNTNTNTNKLAQCESVRITSTSTAGEIEWRHRSDSRDSVFREPKSELGNDSTFSRNIVPLVSSVSTGSQNTPMNCSMDEMGGEHPETKVVFAYNSPLEPQAKHGFTPVPCPPPPSEVLNTAVKRITPSDYDHSLQENCGDVNNNQSPQQQKQQPGLEKNFRLKKLIVTIPSSQEKMESPRLHSPHEFNYSATDALKFTTKPCGLDSLWAKHLADLAEYKSIHGHCNVPFQYSPNKSLGYWVHNQRQVYKKWIKGEPCSLTESRVQSLIEAGFSLKSRRQEIQEKKEVVTNFHTPVSLKTEDGVADDSSLNPHDVEKKFANSENISSSCNVISPADSIHSNNKAQSFKADGFDVAWYRRLEELRDYKNKNNHSDVPSVFPENKPLGTWVMNQRQQYRKLKNGEKSSMNEERVASLNELGFRWYVGKGMRSKEVPKDSAELSSKRAVDEDTFYGENKTLLRQVQVGTRLAIFWDDDKKLYPASVQEVHADVNKTKSSLPSVFSVQYEDGQIEKLGLADIPFQIISQPGEIVDRTHRDSKLLLSTIKRPSKRTFNPSFETLDDALLKKIISYLPTPRSITAFVSTSKRILNLHLKSDRCSRLRRGISAKNRKPSWDLSASQFEGGIVTAAAALSNLAGRNSSGLIHVPNPSIIIHPKSRLQAIMACDGDAFPPKGKKIARDNMRLSIVQAASEHAFLQTTQKVPDIPFWGADCQAYECVQKSFIAFSGMWSCAQCVGEGKDAYCCRLQRKHDFNTIGKRAQQESKRVTNHVVDNNAGSIEKSVLREFLWECSSCTLLNDESNTRCDACGHMRSRKCKRIVKTLERLEDASSGESTHSALSTSQHSCKKVLSQSWSCPYCSTTNYSSSKKCDVCNRSKDGEGKIPKMNALKGNWKCYKCNETNLERNKRCRFCCAWKGGKRTLKYEIPLPRKERKAERKVSAKVVTKVATKVEYVGWECNFCSYKNTGGASICTMCHGSDKAGKQKKKAKHVQQLEDLDYKPTAIKKRKKIEMPIQLEKISSVIEVGWECHKCAKINKATSKRCKTCFSWKGGKRKNMAKRSRRK